MKIQTTRTQVDTVQGLTIVHTTDNRKRPMDRYTLESDGVVVASAHRIGVEGTFSVLLGDAETGTAPRVLCLAKSSAVAIDALRVVASKI